MGIEYKRGQLMIEEIPARRIAEDFGTPVYVYSRSMIVENYRAYVSALKGLRHLICFALKANSNMSVLRILAEEGSGADIVSGGELYRARRAGIPASKIVFAGIGKTEEEMLFALKEGILMFHIESEEEMVLLSRLAERRKIVAPIGFRINPDIDPQTHPYIATGLKEHKFGIPVRQAVSLFRKAKQLPSLKVLGIHVHLGSQIASVSPFRQALKTAVRLKKRLSREGIEVTHLDLGGGSAINYTGAGPALDPAKLGEAIRESLNGENLTIILEPGRSICGNAGVLLTRVLYVKKGVGKYFVVVDAGMNDLIRPALYRAFHRIEPVEQKNRRKRRRSDVVGPVCESSDYLAKSRMLEEVERGEYLAVFGAGAYGFSMSSNYNSRLRPAEVIVKGDSVSLARKRETFEDLINGEL